MGTKRKAADHVMHGLTLPVTMFDEERQVFVPRYAAPKRDDLAVICTYGEAVIA